VGAEGGALIGTLARRLIAETQSRTLYVFPVWDNGSLACSRFFKRLIHRLTL